VAECTSGTLSSSCDNALVRPTSVSTTVSWLACFVNHFRCGSSSFSVPRTSVLQLSNKKHLIPSIVSSYQSSLQSTTPPCFEIAKMSDSAHATNLNYYNQSSPGRPLIGVSSLNITTPTSITTAQLSNSNPDEPQPITRLVYLLLFLLPAEAVLANLLLICVLLRDRRFQKSLSAKYFVLSLSVSDLLVSLIIMPFGVISIVRSQWVFGSFWCELWQTLDYFACTASIFNLCAITSDRYLAISQPIRYSMLCSRRRLRIVIGSVWLAAALVTFPPMIAHQLGLFKLCPSEVCPQCATLFFEPTYVIVSGIISFFIPSALMLAVNYRTHAIARRQIAAYRQGAKTTSGQPLLRINFPNRSMISASGNLHSNNGVVGALDSPRSRWLLMMQQNNHTATSQKVSGGGAGSGGGGASSPVCATPNSATGSDSFRSHQTVAPRSSSHSTGSAQTASSVHHFVLLSTEYKATKTLGLVMGVFFVSWLPYYIVFVVMPFCSVCLPREDLVSPITLWLGWANSGMNPIIYGCLSKKIRRQLRQLLTGSR
jgi:uncharacterized membrane protein YgcG